MCFSCVVWFKSCVVRMTKPKMVNSRPGAPPNIYTSRMTYLSSVSLVIRRSSTLFLFRPSGLRSRRLVASESRHSLTSHCSLPSLRSRPAPLGPGRPSRPAMNAAARGAVRGREADQKRKRTGGRGGTAEHGTRRMNGSVI